MKFHLQRRRFSRRPPARENILDEEEKMDALKKLMAHYHKGKDAYFNPAAISRTLVYVLEVEKITGKRKKPK